MAEEKAHLEIEKTNARILLIAGESDEAWPAEYSVSYIENYLNEKNCKKEYKSIIYPNVSHLTGMMPNKEREKKLYRMLPLIGIMYRSFGKHRKECMDALEQAEKEIIIFFVVTILQMGGYIPLWFSYHVTRIICIVMAVHLSLNTIMNFISKSKKEKYVMTPLSFASAICFWITAL